jgi:hypothetical protein
VRIHTLLPVSYVGTPLLPVSWYAPGRYSHTGCIDISQGARHAVRSRSATALEGGRETNEERTQFKVPHTIRVGALPVR